MKKKAFIIIVVCFVQILFVQQLLAHNIIIAHTSIDSTKKYAAYNQTATVLAAIGDTIYIDGVLAKDKNRDGVIWLKTFAGIEVDSIPYYATDVHCILKYVCTNFANTRYLLEIDGIIDIVFYIKPTHTTAINDVGVDDLELNVCPNPSTDVVYITTAINTALTITNSLAQIVYADDNYTNKSPINIASLPQGVYYIRCNGRVKKLIKTL
jgi:hypothetical protein